jgi:hypothetical protein
MAKNTTKTITSITDKTASQCEALLDRATSLVGDPTEALSAAEIRQMLKLRKGGAEVIPTIAVLARQYGLVQVGSLSVDTMEARLAESTGLERIAKKAEVFAKALSDSTIRVQSECWQTATTLYTMLQRLALTEPNLALALQPIQAFFQTKKTKGVQRKNAKARKVKKLAKELGVNGAPTPKEGGGGAPSVTPPSNTPPANGATQATTNAGGDAPAKQAATS